MKNLVYSLSIAGCIVLAACSGQKKYTISGTLENSNDGDTVFLQKPGQNGLVNIDTAVIKDGKFVFEGKQDTAAYRFITAKTNENNDIAVDFFLENGNIDVQLIADSSVVSGTANNETYQELRENINKLGENMEELYTTLQDENASEEEKEKAKEAISDINDEYEVLIKDACKNNIGNVVGVTLFTRSFYSNTVEENSELLELIPEKFKSDETIQRIKEFNDKKKQTAVGKKFLDFEMKTPDGEAIKLSDYAGKNKLVLVDFWASWCGPCRQDMPNIVELYKNYKDKGLEIVGVSLDSNGEAWKKAITDLNITWPQMSDLKSWKSEGAQIYGVNSIPHTVLIDQDGTIIARGLHGEEVAEKVEELLK